MEPLFKFVWEDWRSQISQAVNQHLPFPPTQLRGPFLPLPLSYFLYIYISVWQNQDKKQQFSTSARQNLLIQASEMPMWCVHVLSESVLYWTMHVGLSAYMRTDSSYRYEQIVLLVQTSQWGKSGNPSQCMCEKNYTLEYNRQEI